MSLTVIDGDFPREVVGAQNLSFSEYRMPARRNSSEFYDAKDKKPAGKREGVREIAPMKAPAKRTRGGGLGMIIFGTLVGLLAIGWLGLRWHGLPARDHGQDAHAT